MNKKIVSLTTAVILTVASAVPVFAAESPSTATVMTTPVTVSTQATVSNGYTLTVQDQTATATTPAESAALAQGIVIEATNGTGIAAAAAQPGLISLAKADILGNAKVKTALAARGLTGAIVNSGMLARADGKTARTRLNLATTGLVPGEKVSVLYYIPGDPTPHVATPAWRNGKLQITLPLPCIYNIVK